MKILLIDDHALVLHGLAELLESRDVEVLASANNGKDGLQLAKELDADLILLDIMMPEMDGIETLKAIRKSGIDIPVLMLTMSHDESHLQAALKEGAQGYLLKDMDPDELVPALEDAISGKNVVAKELVGALTRIVQGKPKKQDIPSTPISNLTPRELEILKHLAEGKSNKVIAKELGITYGTVKLHVKAILRKLNATSRVQAAVMAVHQGLSRSQKHNP
ncbi:MAG: response regulator transcription factor [Gammaproteobacteria bacterium]|nr:response regulator transcription factor [Gammaproteobacteria bacterium]